MADPSRDPTGHGVFVVAGCDATLVSPFGIDDIDLAVYVVVIVEGNPFAVGRPAGCAAIAFIEECQLQGITAVHLVLQYLTISAAELIHNLLSVGGELRSAVVTGRGEYSGLRNDFPTWAGEIRTPDRG